MVLQFFSREERFIFIILIIIFGLDIFLLSKIYPSGFSKQILSYFLGIILLLSIKLLRFRLEDFRKIDWLIYLGVIILLILPVIFSNPIRGSSRWLVIGNFSIQTSELTKPFYIFAVTSLCLKWKENFRSHFFYSLLLVFIPFGLILIQPDLGSALLFFVTASLIIFLSSPRKYLTGIIFLAISFIGIIFGSLFLPTYQKQRITSFLNPEKDPLGTGYNLIQSKIAIGSGRWLGKGFGIGEQTRLKFLPEKHTDFIFSSFAEASGFVGVSVLLLAYLLLFVLIRKKINKAENEFNFILKIVLFFQLWLQTTVNLSMNLGILPITGLPLPFFSYGGSSLATSFIILAFLLK